MHTNWCVLIEISMEIGMLNFWLPLLVTAQTKENYFKTVNNLFKFSAPERDLEYLFWQWKKSSVSSDLKSSLGQIVYILPKNIDFHKTPAIW